MTSTELWLPPPGGLDGPRPDAFARAVQLAATRLLQGGDADDPGPFTQYQGDPNRYMVEVLGRRPHGIQRELNDAIVRERLCAVAAATGPGKTLDAAWLACYFHDCFRNSIVITLATTWDQVTNQLWRKIRAARQAARFKLPGRLLQTQMERGAEWFAMGVSPKQPETLAGFHAQIETPKELLEAYDRWLEMTDEEFFGQFASGEDAPAVFVIIDEASGVPDAMHDAATGLLTNPNSRMLLIGNPTRLSGRFYEVFHPKKGQTEDWPWWTRQWSAFDAPEAIIDRESIRDLQRQCGPNYEKHPLYMIRVLGKFPSGSALGIFPISLLEYSSGLRPGLGGRHIGVDLGFGGGDPCRAVLTVNGRMASEYSWNVEGAVIDTNDSAHVIRKLAKGDTWCGGTDPGWAVEDRNVHIDATGAGVGVYDALKRVCGMYVDPVIFSESPKGDWRAVLGEPPYKLRTRRDELIWVLLRLLQEGRLAIPEKYEGVWVDLIALQYASAGKDGFAPEGSPAFVKREGRSPDWLAATLCACSRADPARIRFRTVRRRRGLRGASLGALGLGRPGVPGL